MFVVHISRTWHILCVSILSFLLLAGCRFDAESNILAGEPTVPVSIIIDSLGGAYFHQVSGMETTSARVDLADDGSGEIVIYKSGSQSETIPFQAVYSLPGTSGAFLVASILPAGATRYYLLRPKANGTIQFIGNRSRKKYDDPKVLLYWANLYAHGVAQIFSLGIMTGDMTLKPVSQEEFQQRLDVRAAADEAARQERRRKAESELKIKEAVARAFRPNKKDVVNAYNEISRRQIAVMSALAGQCKSAGDNVISATACLMGGAGQIDPSSYSMTVIDADIRNCTPITGNVPSAICEVKPVFRAADNQNTIMKLAAGLSTASGYRYVKFERHQQIWSIAQTYDSCTQTAGGFDCRWRQ